MATAGDQLSRGLHLDAFDPHLDHHADLAVGRRAGDLRPLGRRHEEHAGALRGGSTGMNDRVRKGQDKDQS